MSGYTCVFYIYTLKKSVVVKQCVASCLIFVCVILYISGDKDAEIFFNHIGMYSLQLLNVCVFLSFDWKWWRLQSDTGICNDINEKLLDIK